MVPVGRFTFQFRSASSTSFNADLARCQLEGIHLDAHGIFLGAQNRNLRNAGDHRDPLRDARFGILVERVQGQLLGRERQVQESAGPPGSLWRM